MGISVVSSVAVAQGSAGTTALVAAPGAGLRIVMHGADISIDGGGSVKFASASTDLTGAMFTHSASHATISIAGGADCVLRCAENQALNIISTSNPASGVVYYTVESV